jgi:sulfite reductase (ferredoxin)
MASEQSKVEAIKRESDHLRGHIAEELQEATTHFTEDSIQLLKFHGMYQQDDRDIRAERRKQGLEKAYSMMVRARIPGGVLSAEQYLQFDNISEAYGNGTMKITTRQTFQLHGILKSDIKASLKEINDVLVTTLGGCGDQVRNTVGCAEPIDDEVHRQIRADLLQMVDTLGAKTNAYHEIWLDGEKVKFEDEEEPLYGDTYLPRKFKLAFVLEGDNCVDVYDNDLGIVAHTREGEVEGYTLLVGGGMGRTASNKDTYPRLATPIMFVAREELEEACRTIVTIQRDYGNRSDRRYARFKYLLDDKGLDWFQSELESRLGHALTPPRELVWHNATDHLGWHTHGNDQWFLGLFIENGRLKDEDGLRLKSVLREIITEYKPTVHLTVQQNIILGHVQSADKEAIEAKLRDAGVKLLDEWKSARIHSMACVALPTCGLATAEAERALPKVMPELEAMLEGLGLSEEPITMRMTGCPNGCARPYSAEIAFVGRSPGKYDLFIGGEFMGTRLNQLYRELTPIGEFESTLRPLFTAFVNERIDGERFGDYCHRMGLENLQTRHQSIG